MAGQADTQPNETAESIGELLETPEETTDEAEEGQAPEGDEGEETEEGEQDDAEGEGDAKDDDEEITLKHEGQDVKIKKSELTELAQKGYDYTKKTMALADERRGLESERETIQHARSEVEQTQNRAVEDLRAIVNFAQSLIGEPPPIALAQQDPSLYLVQRQQHDAMKDKLAQAQQALGLASKQLETERSRQNAEKQAKTERVLIDTLPGWKENPKQKFEETAKYLTTLGLDGQKAGSAALEPAFWVLATKAMAYDALKEKSTSKAHNPPPKTAKPNSANPINTAQASRKSKFERFDKNPSLENLGALI